MTQSIAVEWVDEIPDPYRSSPYDDVADQVRKTGKVARIATSKSSLHTLANRLRERNKDLTVAARTLKGEEGEGDEYFVFIALKPADEQKKGARK